MAGSDRAVKDKGTPLMNYLQHGHDGSLTFYFGGEGADLIGIRKHRCVFNQLWREKYLAWAIERVNIQACQGWPV